MDDCLERGMLRRLWPLRYPKTYYYHCDRFLITLPDETGKLGMEDLMVLLREYGIVLKDFKLDWTDPTLRPMIPWLQENLKTCKKAYYQAYSRESFMDILKMFDEKVVYLVIAGADARHRIMKGDIDNGWKPKMNVELVVHQPSDTNIRNDVESVGLMQRFIHGNDLTTLIQQFRHKPRSIGSFFVVHVANPFRWYEVFVSLDANVFDEPRLGRPAEVCHTQRYKVCFSDDVELHVDIYDDQTMVQGTIVAKE